jgi:glycosyltransferase involved in cell wall biosynthesis
MPHLVYLAIGFPPAAKSSSYRMRATANLFRDLGWDVTVITIERTAWLREYGVDLSLEAGVDPDIRVVELPLTRIDLDPDIRNYSLARALFPRRWRSTRYRLDTVHFPEPVFGSWRGALEAGALAVHQERPADLVLASPGPYTVLAAAWRLAQLGVPFAIDFRDAWSLDVVTGTVAAGPNSRIGRWEKRLFDHARQIWTVNDPIRDYYVQRYPATATRVHVVRNGFDEHESLAPAAWRPPNPWRGLRFGYLGTMTLPARQLENLLAGWTLARERDAVVARSELIFRGYLGAGMMRGANVNARTIAAYARQGVSYGGPVSRADLAEVYGGFDALVLALIGGRYVTSGKVYEYLSTGLPIVSAHQPVHDAANLLAGYPMWAPTDSVDPEDQAAAFIAGAHLALDSRADDHARALDFAAQFERRKLLRPAIARLAATVTGDLPVREEARP